MTHSIAVRSIVLGEGMPLVCVPLTEQKLDGLIDVIKLAQELGADLVEWRVDHFDEADNLAAVCHALEKVRPVLGEMPLIFTFRRKVEGGQRDIEDAAYVELISRAAKTGLVDLMDIEYSIGEVLFAKLVSLCTEYELPTIASYHNFELTPDTQFIIDKLSAMEATGASMPKIAVMAHNADDMIRLLSASSEYAKQALSPFVAISMGRFGVISRLSGEFFGSALTFASANRVSAPGQVSVADAKQVLSLFHNVK